MKILFLIHEPHQEPLGAGYLISAAREAGHDAQGAFFHTSKQAVRLAAEFRPDIAAYSVMTGAHRFILDVNSLIKSSLHVFSIFGGPHPTYSPDFVTEPGVDAVCRGEGEAAFVSLLDNLASGAGPDRTPNFVVNTPNGVITNPLYPLNTDLDRIPFPDREFFYSSAPLRISRLKSFIAGRGCPFKCTYCFNHVHNEMYRGLGPPVRRRSVDNVVDEVVSVKNRYPLEVAQFMDDTFILSPRWVEEFSEKYPARGGVPFFCNVRAELVDHDMVRNLKRAGCASVCVGVESGDEELRSKMLGRSQSNDRIIEAIRIFRANGIKVMTTNMLGIPGGDLESDLKTFRLNSSCRVDYAWASLTYPYPGTDIHTRAKSLGFAVPSPDDLPASYFNSMPFESPDKHRIENLHKLMAFAVSLRIDEHVLLALINTNISSIKFFYTIVFGFWKLYCYETKIFRRASALWFTSPDFLPRLFSNASIGFKMMSARRRRS